MKAVPHSYLKAHDQRGQADAFFENDRGTDEYSYIFHDWEHALWRAVVSPRTPTTKTAATFLRSRSVLADTSTGVPTDSRVGPRQL